MKRNVSSRLVRWHTCFNVNFLWGFARQFYSPLTTCDIRNSSDCGKYVILAVIIIPRDIESEVILIFTYQLFHHIVLNCQKVTLEMENLTFALLHSDYVTEFTSRKKKLNDEKRKASLKDIAILQ